MYASAADLTAVIPPHDLRLLTDFDGVVDATDSAKVDAALRDATGEIDGYIAKAVTLPLATVPTMLATICRDLALYRLYANIGNVPETQQKLRDQAVSTLRDISKGVVSIGDEAGDDIVTSPGVAMTDGSERELTRKKLKGF